ncbi:lysophospholipid acyltransferase family protein [Fervidicola ferrireducens]|uniref:lysophospholipid acyltransferase family protein n=1 Tax=Fervidicola ferrireducens TaxID=520764 RepID=UPI0009FA20D8|nr:lysophospholipid acyltransferase family protein [Fervidicola ferrireducens]
MLYFLTKLLLRCFFSLTGGVKARGLSNVPKEGPLIVVSNHQSILDPLVIMAYIPRKLRFLAAAYLFKIPGLNILLRLYGAIPVNDTERGDISSLKKALRILKGGGAVALFPEGGVSPDGKLRPFKQGFAYLALKSGAAVLPVAVKGTTDVLPVGRYFPKRGRIELKVGEPISVGKKDRISSADEEWLGEVSKMVEESVRALLF